MTVLAGVFEIDGEKIKWRKRPDGGTTLFVSVLDAVQLPGEPNENDAKCALIGYKAGKLYGENSGRAKLQVEFRNLMDIKLA